jgi:hypothetical protein
LGGFCVPVAEPTSVLNSYQYSQSLVVAKSHETGKHALLHEPRSQEQPGNVKGSLSPEHFSVGRTVSLGFSVQRFDSIAETKIG